MIFQRYLPQYQKDDSHVLFSRQLVEWNYIIVLDIKGKFNFIFFCYIHIVETPTNKGANSYKLKMLKKGISGVMLLLPSLICALCMLK